MANHLTKEDFNTYFFIQSTCRKDQSAVEFLGWYGCHSVKKENLSPRLSAMENIQILLDTRDNKNYLLLHNPDYEQQPVIWFSGIHHCLNNHLLLAYDNLSHRLYCHTRQTVSTSHKEETTEQQPTLKNMFSEEEIDEFSYDEDWDDL
ncbi:MAG: hypothetical protein ACR2PX_18650 [Endozoicomonas sp.]|uniref:hypothetical protein n=1 Tax=Endozoicomonas sp. TaxID=1892382 RepID=UPI003D9AFC8C